MKRCLLLLALTSALGARPPGTDRRGYYFNNCGPVAAPQGGGSLWRVVSERLEGHRLPDSHSPVVKVFRAGAVLQTDIGRGGSDEVNVNAADAKGNTWMAVKGPCFVRAHRDNIAPVLPKEPEPESLEAPVDSLMVGDAKSEKDHAWDRRTLTAKMAVNPYTLNDLVIYGKGHYRVEVEGKAMTSAGGGRFWIDPALTRLKQSIRVRLVGSGPLTGVTIERR